MAAVDDDRLFVCCLLSVPLWNFMMENAFSTLILELIGVDVRSTMKGLFSLLFFFYSEAGNIVWNIFVID